MGTTITMKDVAEMAGVSKATVSMVLNHNDRISGPTRERVQWTMNAMGYKPNDWARKLGAFRGQNKDRSQKVG